jgi:hypothetical protein
MGIPGIGEWENQNNVAMRLLTPMSDATPDPYDLVADDFEFFTLEF